MSLKSWIARSLFSVPLQLREWLGWRKRGYTGPSPASIKRTVLLRNGGQSDTWVETGTFRGDTTAVLAKHATKVISIEPQVDLYKAAISRFRDVPNVQIVNGLSEDVFPGLLQSLSGSVSFWLDGHYSAGATHKGPQDTPIAQECEAIRVALPHLGQVVVLIDDIRCFESSDPEHVGYPTLDWVVEWARACGLIWHIEQDIFVARR